jgi:hypothetical protein
MPRFPRFVIAALLVGSSIAPAFSEEGKKSDDLTLDQVPAAVKATLLKEANGATVTEIEKKTHKDKTVYVAEIPGAAKGEEIKLFVAEDGTLLKKKTEKEGDEGEKHEHGDKDK